MGRFSISRASVDGGRRGSLGNQEEVAQLAALGHQQELERNFSFVSMLGLAFAILNSWTALAASISLALPSGGPSSVTWGLITSGVCNLALAAGLAEFLSAYPTSAGQYHWAALVSPKKWVPIVSWTTGWINCFGWIALTATAGLLGSQLIVGIISLYSPSYNPQPWHQFLIYIGYTLAAFLVNAFMTRILPMVGKGAFLWSLAGFAIISITLLACSSPTYQSGSFVYGTYLNETGWNNGVAWLLGLLQGSLGLCGFDAVAHMIEELPNPTVIGPRIMIGTVGIGITTGFIFLSILLFVLTNLDDVVSSSAGPLLAIFYQSTNNMAGSVCLMMFPLVCLLFAGIGIMTTSSRMTYAFARDRGLPFSKHLAKVHKSLDVPLYALIFTTVWVIIFGCIFLGSSSAFNAIVSASVVAVEITYAIPPAIHCLRGRKLLPETRSFKLPTWLGWCCNLLGIAFVILETVLFNFPPGLPVDGTNMNYCVVAFAIVLIISLIQWFVDGRKNFKGPVVDLGEMLGAVPEHQRNEMLQQSEILQAEQTKTNEEHSAEADSSEKSIDGKL